jgi:hypothetical protein
MLAEARPADHAEALALMEAMADCGCGGAPALAEAKKAKANDDGDAEDKGDKGADEGLEDEVARLKKKGMPEKMARKVAEKKLKEGAEPHGGHSRLATRLTESPGAMLGLLLFDPLKHPRAHGGEFAAKAGTDSAPSTLTGAQIKRHSRLADGARKALDPMKGGESDVYGSRLGARKPSMGKKPTP